MARMLTPKDAHNIMNAIAKQACGATALTVVDGSTFTSVGETVLNSGIENVLSSLSIVIGKTLVSVKPYKAKITLFQTEDNGLYTSRIRKISFYKDYSVESAWVNTDAHNRNLYNGYDNTAQGSAPNASLGTMWEQHKKVALELNFGGSSVYDFCMTFYEAQLKAAFTDEAEFIKFWNAQILSHQNDMEMVKESFNRMQLLNAITGTYALSASMPNSVVNLTKGFNDKFGTSYSSAELRSTHLREFLAYMVAEIKKISNYMEEPSMSYHWTPSKTVDGVTYDEIERHTPKADQRLMLLQDLFIDAEALVLPEIFNDRYLKPEQYEAVGFWQSQTDRAGIKFKPAIPNVSNPAEQTAPSAAVELDYVVGILFNKDGILTNYQYEGSDVTPIEARKKYRNSWNHVAKNSIVDFSEPMVIFTMEDED